MRHPYALPVAMALIALGGGCGPGEIRKDSNCTEENHCHLDESGSQTCDDGFVWEDPDDDNNFRCVPAVQQPVAPLLATFSVTPSSVVRGTSTDVVWNWTYVNSPIPTPTCTIDHSVGTLTSGTTTSITIGSATTYTVTCTNASGSDTAVTTVGVVDAPVWPNLGTFTATPSSVTNGVATDVVWSWTYVNTPTPTPACTVDHGVGLVTSGTATSVTINSATTYTLTCTNAAGVDTAMTTVGVAAAPIAPNIGTFTATPSSVTNGMASNVTWDWTYSNSPTPTPACTVDHGVGLVTSGTATSVTINSATTYTLTCTNAAGSDTAVTTVGVAAAPVAPNIGTFIATPSSVTTGVPTNVTWSWTYANSPAPTPVCVVGNGVGSLTSGTVTSVTISSATTYTLTCTNVAGSDTAQATVSVVSAPVAPNIGTFTATPSSVTTGVPTNVTWTWTYANSPTPTPACTVDRGVGAVASGTATGGS